MALTPEPTNKYNQLKEKREKAQLESNEKWEANKTVYQRNRKRSERLKDRKCVKCGAQAWGKIQLTQELLCAKHMVAPLNEEILKQSKPEEAPS